MSFDRLLLDEVSKFDFSKGLHPAKPRYLIVKKTDFWSYILLLVSILGVLFLFVGRLWTLQILENSTYANMASDNRISELLLFPERGNIFDRNGKLIAKNEEKYSLQFDFSACVTKLGETACEKEIERLRSFVLIREDALDNKNSKYLILASGLDKNEILPLEANISEFPYAFVVASPYRIYNYDEEFSHVIGYVGFDSTSNVPRYVGKSGLEEFYQSQLQGIEGTMFQNVDSMGVLLGAQKAKNALPGKNLTLYLDYDLQKKAYELLRQKVEESEATGGAVVIQDPLNGGILALVSYPSFSSNKMSSGITASEYQSLINDPRFSFFNRSISGAYAPGSTFKMVTAAAALEENIVTPYFSIFDIGYISVNGYTFRNWKLDGHGRVDLVRALQVSNDTYFYTIGGGHFGIKGLGIKKLHDWAEKFGYGKQTGVDLFGESAGLMPDGTSRDWYLGDDFISAIGQGDILATPLQVNSMTMYFANGGKIYRPRIVKDIEGMESYSPEILSKDMLSKQNYDLIRLGMYKALSSGGTSYPFFSFQTEKLKAAGKTGTSEYFDSRGVAKTHAWLTVFAPYYENQEDQAKITSSQKPIVLTVLLEGGGAGSDDASPLARQLVDFWHGRN